MKIRKSVVAWIGLILCAVIAGVIFATNINNWFATIPAAFFMVFFVLLIKEPKTPKASNANGTGKPRKKVKWSVVIPVLLSVAAIITAIVILAKSAISNWFAIIPAIVFLGCVLFLCRKAGVRWSVTLALIVTLMLSIVTIVVAVYFGWLFLIPMIALCVAFIWLVYLLNRAFLWIPIVALIIAILLLGNYGITGSFVKDWNKAIDTLTVKNLVVEDKADFNGDVNVNEGNVNIDKGDVNVNEGDVNVDKGDVNVNEGDVNVDKGDVNVNEGDVNVDKGDVNVNEGDVNVDKGDVNVNEGNVNIDKGEVHVHNYTSKVVKPTCTSKGYTTYTCSCGDSYEADYTDALGHNYTSKVVKPTCTSKGYTTYTCSCGDSYEADYTDALGHNYTSKVINPTTSEGGYTLHTCTRCDDSYKDNYTDKLQPVQPKNPTLSVSTDYMVKGDTVIVTLKDADASNVVIKYVDPNTGNWVIGGASLKDIGNNQYRLIVEEVLWTMAVDLTIGLDSNNNYQIVTLEPCYE